MKTVAVSTLLRKQVLVYEGQELTIDRVTSIGGGKTAIYVEGRTEPITLPTGASVTVLATSALHDVWG